MIEEKRGGRKLLAHLGASIKKPIYFSCLSDRKGEKRVVWGRKYERIRRGGITTFSTRIFCCFATGNELEASSCLGHVIGQPNIFTKGF